MVAAFVTNGLLREADKRMSDGEFCCARFQGLFDFLFGEEEGWVMGHGDPLPSSTKWGKG